MSGDDGGPPIIDGALLERQKENIVPVREGRNANAISQRYSVSAISRDKELEATHARFRQQIDALGDDDFDPDDDPLEVYWQYVSWIMENYPSGSSKASGLLQVLEDATRRFHDEPLYKNDRRYIRLWLEYAGLVEQSERVFAFMLANEIGFLWPHVYEEYAMTLERNRNLSKADGIYRLAINRRVKGLASLKVRYKEFQTRCLAQPAEYQASTSTPAPIASTTTARVPLGGRTILGSRAPANQQQAPQSLSLQTPGGAARSKSNAGKVAVFVDSGPSNGDVQTNEWPNLQSRAESVKENKGLNSSKGISQPRVAPMTPKVSIYRDETTTPGPMARPGTPEQVLRSREPDVHDELRKDPLRNYGSDAKFELDLPALNAAAPGVPSGSTATPSSHPTRTPKASSLLSSSTSQSRPASSSMPPPSNSSQSQGASSSSSSRPAPVPMVNPNDLPYSAVGPKSKPSLPPPVPGKRPEVAAFDIDVVWQNDEEYSREESRARAMGLLNKKWTPPPIRDFGDDEVAELKGDGEGGGGGRKSMRGKRRSTAVRFNSSPTTNTKAALNDVFDMFNTTVKLDDVDDEEESDEDEEPGPSGSGSGSGSGSQFPPIHASAPKTPSALGTAAKQMSWTPHSEGPVEPRSALRAVDTPSQAGRVALSAVTPKFSIALDAPSTTTKTPAVTPGPRLAVLQDKTPGFLAATPRAPLGAVHDPPAAPSTSTKTPSAKFAIFQDGGEKRFPSSVARTPGLSTVTPLAPKAIPPPRSENEDAAGPSSAFAAPSGARSVSTMSVVPAEEEDDRSPAPKPLVYREPTDVFGTSSSSPAARHSPDVSHGDVFGQSPVGRDRHDEQEQVEEEGEQNPDEEEMEEEPIDEYAEAEDDFDVDDIHPRSYEMRGGVAIMTPITERTLEYETAMRSTRTSSSSRASNGHFLDAFDASPGKGRSMGRPSLTAPRRSSLKPRTSFLPPPPPPPPDAEDGHENDQVEGGQEGEEVAEPLNPFAPEIVSDMLDRVWSTLDLALYRDLRDTKSTHLEDFDVFARKLNKSRLSRSAGPPNAPPMKFEIGGAEYLLIDKIGEGGFGAVFLAEDVDAKELADENPEDYAPDYGLVAIKTVRPSMLWEFAVLHVIRSSLPVDILNSIITPRDFYHFQNESLFVMDYSSQGTLLDSVNAGEKMGIRAQDTAGIDELLIMFFTVELLRLVRCMHEQSFIHGDLKIDNCLLRLADPADIPLEATYDPLGEGGWAERGVTLIDFGRTIDIGLFEPGQTFIGDWPTDARDCIEMREGRPWTYQTDYAGLAGIVYCLMFGKYIESVEYVDEHGTRRFKLATPFKRYWQVDIWTRLFDVLLNPVLAREDGTLPLVDELGELELDMAEWLMANCEKKGKSLRKMLNSMATYARTRRPPSRR